MDSRTQERVERWDSRPFTGGYNELSTLAADAFSGVVTASETWLFMLNGRVVGVVDGEIEAFEEASGTIYAAPHASLPLLCSMHAQGGETRANYYTNETPLSEVDRTLQDGSFTGYIELSEQVLSGDYYAVYYGGRRMAAAYIGNAERLLTGDDAFERADDEVGIYEVVDVEIDVTDVPEDGSTQHGSATATGAQTASTPQSAGDSADGSSEEPTPSATDATRPASASELRETADLTDLSAAEAANSKSGSESASSAPEQSKARGSHADPETVETGAEDTDSDSSERAPDQESSQRSSPEPDTISDDTGPEDETGEQTETETDRTETSPQSDQSESVAYDEDQEHEEASPESDEDGELDARLKQEERWRETRSIPSIDPEKSEHVEAIRQQSDQRPAEHASDATQRQSRESTHPGSSENSQVSEPARIDENTAESRNRSQTEASPEPQAAHESTTPVEQEAANRPGAGSSGSEQGSDESVPESLEVAIDEYEQRIETLTQHARKLESHQETLETENANLESERERLQAENQDLSATVERLRSTIDDLEAECERLRNAETLGAGETTGFSGSNSGRQLSAHEALAGTNLFVRYASKSDSTLQSAHGGDGEQESVASNLQLEQHTSFDASDVTVAGQPYEEFLTDTIAYKFVDWLVETLLFEIRDTGRGNGLADLYDSIPQIDRAELHATVSLEDDETEDVPEEVTFDVVAFDKMGNPLIVANLNDSRDPATERMLAELEEAASAVTANYPNLGAAMVVTSSYFEPGALEVTERATSSGFLSRGSKLSYVTLSRKQGYHLALVESRSSGFHMNVPEL